MPRLLAVPNEDMRKSGFSRCFEQSESTIPVSFA